MSKKHITVGIAGHVDHGKTALVKCLTGVDTDRLQEEKRRGLSIESGIAPFELPSGDVVALVDVPGHTDYMKNTIRGLSGVDAAVLVVAADDGVMPQTREHIEILRLFGAQAGFVVLTKADLVDEETLELAELELRELLRGSFLEGKSIIPFSALDRRGVEEIRAELGSVAEGCRGKDVQGAFRLWIDQVRGVAGFGTVASGTILSGHVREDDPLVLLPSGRETRARSLESHHMKLAEAFAGQRVGINLHKVQLDEVERGMLITNPGIVVPSRFLNVDIQVLDRAKKPLGNRQRVKLYLGTSVTNATVVLMGKDELRPGERSLAQFMLKPPVPALPADPFVLCLLDVRLVIGGGRVLETRAEKYRLSKAGITLPYLDALRARRLSVTLSWFFKRAPTRPVSIEHIVEATGFSRKQVEFETGKMLAQKDLLLLSNCGLVERASYEEMKAKLLAAIRRMLKENVLKQAMNVEEARSQTLPSADQRLVQQMLNDLCREGFLSRIGAGYGPLDVAGNITLEQEKLIGLLLEYAAKSGVNPFSADTIWKVHDKKFEKKLIQKHLDYLKTQGKLALLGDKRFLSVEAVEEIKQRVCRVIEQKGAFGLSDFKETLGYGRTVAIPVLEHLDTIGYTRRRGDERVLMERKAE